MSKKIKCNGCKINLGEIRDASLRVNIVYYCNICGNKPHLTDPKPKHVWDDEFYNDKEKAFNDIFGDNFGDIFGKE